MEPKKNPKADLSRRSVIFFQIGLVVILALVYFAIEHKTYEKEDLDLGQVQMDDQLEEEVPITELNTPPPPPPPPPPPAPEILDVVEDDVEVEETVIESTETSQEEEIVEVEDVQFEEEEVIEDVPFAVIENVPIYPGCENEKGNDAKKKCMSEAITKLVNRKFNTELGSELGLSGVNRIYVRFKIDSKGNIVDIGSRGPHPRLEQEAERVIKLLPKMTPGKQRGKPVGVLYSLPIVFQVQD
ncbi:MAG: energy transducer TonB [Cytophagaceae bacterium]|nr:energy transducer TonB [Cytophagaceae bacterium]